MSRSSPKEILQGLGIEDPKDIDIEAIAWHLGAAVKYRKLERCEALIVGAKNRAIITINEQSTSRRQRFSVAHEIGHWMLHRGLAQVCRAADIGSGHGLVSHNAHNGSKEKMADRFAADLLLPRYLLFPAIEHHRQLSFKMVLELCDLFDTSRPATTIRVIETDVFPAILICHNRTGRRWFTRAPQVPSRWFPRDDLDPEGFAFDVLFGTAPNCPLPRKIGADAWFDRAEAANFYVKEQTMRVGEEILTLVLLDGDMLDD